MIKTMTFFWGNNPMSYFNYLSIKTFRKHNPDWHITLGTPMDDNISKPIWVGGSSKTPYSGKCYSKEAREFVDRVDVFDFAEYSEFHDVVKADIYRIHTLSHAGGWWSDMDVLFVKPMDFGDGINKWFDSCDYAGTAYSIGKQMVYPTGVCYTANPDSEMMQGLLIELRRAITYKPDGYDAEDYQCAGPTLFLRVFGDYFSNYPNSAIYNILQSTFYPINYNETAGLYDCVNKLSDRVIGVHWYGGAKLSMEFKDKLTEANVNTHRNLIGDILDEI